jgi:hypothetical protein
MVRHPYLVGTGSDGLLGQVAHLVAQENAHNGDAPAVGQLAGFAHQLQGHALQPALILL